VHCVSLMQKKGRKRLRDEILTCTTYGDRNCSPNRPRHLASQESTKHGCQVRVPMDKLIKEDFIRKGGASRTARAAAVPIASAVRASSSRPIISITTGSADVGSAVSGAGVSTGDASAGAAYNIAAVLEGALKKLEITRGVFAGAIAFAVIPRSCTGGFVWSAWV